MATHAHVLAPILAKLEQHVDWSDGDRHAFTALPIRCIDLRAGAHLSRQGDDLGTCGALLSGFAFLYRILSDGSRQIVSVRMAGDFLNLQGGLLQSASHNVQMLTPARIALLQVADISALAAERPTIHRALWLSTLLDSAIYSQWITSVGRRDARSRIAHLLCEFAIRLRGIGLCDALTYAFPMTQEQLGDATGLTSAHVNRMLQQLRKEGLIRTQTGPSRSRIGRA
ncbi:MULTISPECIES: Crp/Fnr family transcriptional regulator [Bacteria]|uniref:Crp/Fnr family transcriptional regulator n=1 Tax=Bacteria TaxID=2 RepID=UPI001402D481|nr:MULTISPECIES: Crp/Fnr family transcriptional regulator [Bacteria]